MRLSGQWTMNNLCNFLIRKAIMAKRFISTQFFEDPFISELSKDNKLFYIYLVTNCDHVGIIDINWKLAEFLTDIKGLSKGRETVVEQLGNRIVRLKTGYFFIPRFVPFQYGAKLNPNANVHKSVIKRLTELNLINDDLSLRVEQGLTNPLVTPKDKDKAKALVKAKDEAKIMDKYKEKFNSFRVKYQGTKKGNDTEFANFIKKHKDWKDILEIIENKLDYQIVARKIIADKKQFVPEWKNLATWINGKHWEDEYNTTIATQKKSEVPSYG